MSERSGQECAVFSRLRSWIRTVRLTSAWWTAMSRSSANGMTLLVLRQHVTQYVDRRSLPVEAMPDLAGDLGAVQDQHDRLIAPAVHDLLGSQSGDDPEHLTFQRRFLAVGQFRPSRHARASASIV